MAPNNMGKAQYLRYLSSEHQFQHGRLCHRQFVHDKNTILAIYLPYLTMTKTIWWLIPGVKHCFHIIYHLNPKSKMDNFVIDKVRLCHRQLQSDFVTDYLLSMTIVYDKVRLVIDNLSMSVFAIDNLYVIIVYDKVRLWQIVSDKDGHLGIGVQIIGLPLVLVAILFLTWSNKADKWPVLCFCHRQIALLELCYCYRKIVRDKVGHVGIGV